MTYCARATHIAYFPTQQLENMEGEGSPRASTLLRAVQRGDYGVLAYLLGPSNRGHQEDRAHVGLLAALLVEASGREHLDCIELLLQKMMKPSPKRNLKRRGCFPMHTAAGAGAIESIELLLSAGLSPKTRDRSGRTPLHLAAAQGSVECVSFLCAVARSTVLSRDRAKGDTPIHFAVRARHSVCVEVLLLNAQGGCEILHETNDKGETPIDIATALGDTSLILRSGGARGRGGGTARLQGGVDIQRIMAVWERFFENAAMTSVRGGGEEQASDILPLSNHHEENRQCSSGYSRDTTIFWEGNDACQLASGNRHAAATLEGDGGVDGNNTPMLARKPSRHDSSPAITTGWVAGEMSSEQCKKNEGEGMLCYESGLNDRSRGASVTDRLLPRLPPSLPTTEKNRYSAWEASTACPLPDKMGEGVDFSHHEPPPQQCTEEELRVRLETGATLLSSDDADLHLFRTPRGCNDSEELWLAERCHEGRRSTREPSPEDENSNPLHRHQAWVACWDAASESVYYWNSESGELTWNAPPPANPCNDGNGLERYPSRVWDPEREAFFAVDDDGVSHWLIEGEAADGAASTTILSGQATSDDSRVCSTWPIASASSQQGSEAKVRFSAEGLRSTEENRVRDDSRAVVAEQREEGAAETRMLPAHPERERDGVALSQYPLPEATQEVHNDDDDDDDDHGFYDTEEGSCRHLSQPTPTADARHKHGPGLREDDGTTVTHDSPPPHSPAEGSSASATSNGSPRAEIRSDDVDFFDTKTWEDHHQLSAWVLWCAQPSRDDDDDNTPPYFVNEETCASSWVLPPEAVATSKGWVRAWSEEHQARFYANQWTGRVTWDLKDLEAEGWLAV